MDMIGGEKKYVVVTHSQIHQTIRWKTHKLKHIDMIGGEKRDGGYIHSLIKQFNENSPTKA